MSWSIDLVGSSAAVRAAAADRLTKLAVPYVGKNEEKDILMARDRILATLDEAARLPDDWSHGGIKVTASGSASPGYTSISISVQKVQLCLDAPAVPSPAPTSPGGG